MALASCVSEAAVEVIKLSRARRFLASGKERKKRETKRRNGENEKRSSGIWRKLREMEATRAREARQVSNKCQGEPIKARTSDDAECEGSSCQPDRGRLKGLPLSLLGFVPRASSRPEAAALAGVACSRTRSLLLAAGLSVNAACLLILYVFFFRGKGLMELRNSHLEK